MRTLFLLPVIAICAFIEVIKLLKSKKGDFRV
jgi:hypothetical protein